MFDQCPNEKVGIIYYLLLDYPRQMNVIVGKYGNYEPGIVSECRGRCSKLQRQLAMGVSENQHVGDWGL